MATATATLCEPGGTSCGWRSAMRRNWLRPLNFRRAHRAGPAGGARLSALCPLAVHRAGCARATRPTRCCRQVLPLASGAGISRRALRPIRSATAAATLGPGLLQKYSGRALLITTGACAVHCRYCFRRHYPYSEAPALARRLAAGDRPNRRRSDDRRSDPLRRRSADAGR